MKIAIADRGRMRIWRAAITAMVLAIAKVSSALSILVTIPLMLDYLGRERFGVWMTVASLSVILSFADLGLSNGLVTKLASLHGHGDRNGMKGLISNTIALLIGTSLILISIVLMLIKLVNEGALFNISDAQFAQEAKHAFMIYMICLVCGIPFGSIRSIQSGMQEGFINGIWQCVSSVLGVIALCLAISAKAELPVLAAAFGIVPVIVNLANCGLFFVRNRDLIPSIHVLQGTVMKEILSSGLKFFSIQISLTIAFGIDSFIISQTLGPAAIADYTIVEKIFALITTTVIMITSPLWPAYGEAIASGDRVWVRRTFFQSLFICTSVAVVGVVFLLVYGRSLIGLWVGQGVLVSLPLMVGFGAWRVLEACCTSTAMYLNGRGIVARQAILSFVTAICMLVSKYSLVGVFGLVAMPWVTFVCYFVFTAIPYGLILRKDSILWGTKRNSARGASSTCGSTVEVSAVK